MSSHKEAPGISNDPAADNTDVYAFVSPDSPDTVTLIANFVPLEDPAGGPNFFEFGDDVLYEICVDNNGDGVPDVTYQFNFTTTLQNPNTFLYNTGPITSLTDPHWNRRQTYSVTRVVGGNSTTLGSGLACPPCNIGPASTPNYHTALANPAVHTLSTNHTVFAGQRAEGFYVDLGAIFDLGRPASVPAGVPVAHAGRARHQHAQAEEHQQHRDPGAEDRPDRRRRQPDQRHRRVLDDRRVRPGQPPGQPDAGQRRHGRQQRRLRADLAAGQPAGQRGADPAGPQGSVQLPAAVGRQPVRDLRRSPRARRPAQRSVPGRVPAPGGA